MPTMKARATREHREHSIHDARLTSMMGIILSIVRFIVVVVGIALMVFK